jgi:hypothetical protein
MSGTFLPADVAPAALLTVTAAVLAGLARGFSGFGAAMIYVPIASAVLSPVVAMPILLIADLVVASPMIARAARRCAWSDVGRVTVGGLLGLPIGNFVLTATDAVTVRWLVTALILVSLVLLVTGARLPGPPTRATTAGVGLVSGLMSGLAQIGGPPVVMYWLSERLPPDRMRANLIVYFAILMWVSLLLFLLRGLLTPQVLWLAALSAPGYAAGIYAGSALFGYASPQLFRWLAVALIALATLIGLPVLDPYLR